MFTWIREKVKAAVLGGFQDALDELHDKSEPVVVPELRYEPEPRKVPANGKREVARG